MRLNLKKYIWPVLIGILFLLSLLIRFYQIDNSKLGFYLDEASIGYNAYSILETGKDEFGKPFPILFRAFTDFKSPLYIYFSVIPIKIFGLGVFSTRFVSALSGSIAIIVVYFLLKLITKNNRFLSFLSALILAVSPWHVFYSRAAWETNLSFLLLLLATLFCVYGYKINKRILFFFGGILFVISIYAYFHGQRAVAPLIFGFYFFYYFKWILENKKILILGLTALILFSLPVLIISLTPGSQSRMKSLSIFSEKTILPWQNQNTLNTGDKKFSFFVDNRTTTTIRKWFALYTAYYTPRNLFSPDPVEKQRWPVDLATFYSWQFPFYVLGFFWFFKKREYEQSRPIMIPWLIFSPLAASIAGDPFATVRALPLVFPFSFIIAVGIFETLAYVQNKMGKNSLNRLIPLISFSVFFLLFITSIVNLFLQFFYILPYLRPTYWNIGYEKLSKDLLNFTNEKIVIDNLQLEGYIHILFFTKFDPKIYQKETGYLELPNYYTSFERQLVRKFGQFESRRIDWGKELKEKNIIVGDDLIISDEKMLSDPRLQLLEKIYYPDQSVAFKIIKALHE